MDSVFQSVITGASLFCIWANWATVSTNCDSCDFGCRSEVPSEMTPFGVLILVFYRETWKIRLILGLELTSLSKLDPIPPKSLQLNIEVSHILSASHSCLLYPTFSDSLLRNSFSYCFNQYGEWIGLTWRMKILNFMEIR